MLGAREMSLADCLEKWIAAMAAMKKNLDDPKNWEATTLDESIELLEGIITEIEKELHSQRYDIWIQ